MYQLQRPRLDIDMSKNKKKTGYDVILSDEAQDIAPVMFDIVLRQDKCTKILVGDAHQQIYNFTGAMNVMEKIHAVVPRHLVTHRRLVRSFRFGLEIANVANAILNVKRENDALLVGSKETRLTDKCVFMTKNIAASESRTLGAYGDSLPNSPSYTSAKCRTIVQRKRRARVKSRDIPNANKSPCSFVRTVAWCARCFIC